MKRVVCGSILVLAALILPEIARADCQVVIATTSSGATFPCTVCIEGGRVVSANCQPISTGR
jgi:hypothetical protein